MTDFFRLSAYEVATEIQRGDISAAEYIAFLFARIRDVEPRIRAFITLNEEHALEAARDIDRQVARGVKVGRLCGVGLAVKDNICTRGIRTTCASKMLSDFVPPYDSTVIERIKREGGIILGKTNLDEFAMGTSTEYSFFGPTLNPWDTRMVPGGSSGGSAAAVAAGEATLALGSDTGGSIRCPASFCSVVGLKGTYGLVSRYGLISYANSLEQIGPIGRNVRDCAFLFSVICGRDNRDSTSLESPTKDYLAGLTGEVEGLKIGVPSEFLAQGTGHAVCEKTREAVSSLSRLGAVCEETRLKSLDYALAAYYIIAMSEASSNLARYDGLRYGYRIQDKSLDWNTVFSKNRRGGFSQEVKRRILLGTFALSAGYYDEYYLKAQKIRTLIVREFKRAFHEFDALVGPTMPILPFKMQQMVDDPLQMYMCDIDTVPANLAGLPAISVPCGFEKGLPIGFQVLAPHFREDTVFRVASAVETSVRGSLPQVKS